MSVEQAVLSFLHSIRKHIQVYFLFMMLNVNIELLKTYFIL